MKRSHSIARLRIFLLTLLLVVCATATTQGQSRLQLTSEEIAWRQAHPVVTVGVFVGDQMPLEAWEGGKPQGLGIDYARLLAERAGLQLEFHPYTDWAGVAFDITPPPYDLLPAQPVTPDRRSRYDLLHPFLSGAPALVAPKGDLRIRSAADLAHARIAVERRFRTGNANIAPQFPGATLVYANTGREALDLVAQQHADAYIGMSIPRAQVLLSRRPADDLAIVSSAPLEALDVAPAVNQSKPILVGILRKAEATIDEQEIETLRARWGAAGQTEARGPDGTLSQQERDWLSKLPVLRLGYEVDRYPYSFVDGKGDFSGLAADYVRLLQKELGVRIQLIPATDWNTLQRMVRAHEVDLIAAGTTNDFPNSEMGFSQPYEYFPEVIVARLDGPPIAGPKDLDSKKIAFRMESGLYSRLRARYGENMLYPTTSNEAGLAAVDTRTADAFIGTLPAIDALIRNRYVGNLHVIGPAGMDQEFSIGVRSEFAQLLPLIDHVLGNMDSGDKQAMRSRWIAAEYRYGAPWKWVLIGVVIAALVLASIVGAYARLRRTSKALQSAERAHAAQLRFQQELMETIPYPVFVKDKNGRYLAVNRAYEDTLHCSRQDLLGHTIEETQHLHGVSAKALMQADQDLMVSESGSTRRELKYIDAHDGGERSIIIWLRPFSDEPTGTKSLLGTAVDISEVRAAEARARASEQQLSDITQTMPSVVFRIIAYPDGRRRFTYAGGAVEELLDMPVQSLLDDEPLLLSRLHPDDKPVVTHNVEISRRTLQPMPAFDFRLRVSDGWRWLRTEGGHPRPIGDGSAEWTGYWIDTTTLHEQAEALHRAKAEAEAATAAKGAFLAAMSHEIRTPMADVLALIELLGRSDLNSDQTTMLAMIQESARSLMQVLDDILDHSRLEAGRMQIEHTRFDVRNLLDGIVGVFAARAAAKGIVLRSIMDWRLAAEFYGDPFRIRQILSNLMSNAVKFTEQGSIVLHVEIGRRTPSGQLLRFNVTDTGIGIKPDNLARLFQPFTQAEDSTARRFGGTGLGLSISRRLASMMDGEIRLQSTPGSGTHATFEVALEVAEHCVTQSQLAGKTVALACTDEARSDELSNALSALGFRVMQIDEEDFAEPITGVDLFVADTALPARLHPSATPCLFVDDRAPHRMPYRSSAGVVVPTGPLLYHSLELGCLEALGIPLPVVAPTKAAERVQHRAHVLVAEDHANNRVVMARQLEALGYPYSIVENGLEALDLWSRQHFDVLITDCHMPGLDGYDLARRIREHEGNQRRLVILGVSASAQPEQLEYCRQAGMDDFLSKPVRLDDLAVMLSRHLDVEHAAASSGGPAMDGASKAAPLPHLQQIFRDRNNLAVYLRDLLSNCRADLSELDFLIQTADVAGQRRLLHRIEGGLDTLQPTGSESFHRDDLSVSARRSDVVSAMEQLEQLVRGFFNDVDG